MPSESKSQQEAMAIAEHSPDKLYSRNRGLLKLSKSQLSEFASTSKGNLPDKVQKAPKKSPSKGISR